MLGVPVGGALSFFFSGRLAQAYGWRSAMVLAAAPALLLVPALLLLPEPTAAPVKFIPRLCPAAPCGPSCAFPPLVDYSLRALLNSICTPSPHFFPRF